MSQGFLAELESRAARLSRSERRVLNLVLQRPQQTIRMSVSELATRADVSEPTVLRFCRALDFGGFREFKVRLAQGLGTGVPYVHRDVSVGDDPKTVVAKIFQSEIAALENVSANIDYVALDHVVTTLVTAHRIDCFGIGLSGIAAIEAQQAFMTLGIPTTAHRDAELQMISAATLSRNDCALCFSFSGAMKDIVQIAEKARSRGVPVVSITRPLSPLAEVSTITLPVDTRENTAAYGPMASRIAHFAVIDVLATLLALRRGPQAIEQLHEARNSLHPYRLDF